MSRSKLQMRFDDWPAVDRQSWNALFRDGDIFDGRGAALQWRDATRKTNLNHYARWLAWLDSKEALDRTCTLQPRNT